MLEKKENVLLKKATAEVEKAKEFTRAKNKKGKTFTFGMSNLDKKNFSLGVRSELVFISVLPLFLVERTVCICRSLYMLPCYMRILRFGYTVLFFLL